MNLIKWLIAIPLLAALIVLGWVNQEFTTISFWPFDIEITVISGIVIVFFFVTGMLFGILFTWMSYAFKLYREKRQNKKLYKEQKKLAEKVSDLQKNISIKDDEPKLEKTAFKEKIKNLCKRKNLKDKQS